MRLVREKSKETAGSPIVSKIINLIRSNGVKVNSTQTWQPSTFAPYNMINVVITAPVDDSGSRYVPSAVLDAIALLKRMHKNFLYSIYFNPKTPRLITIQIQEFEDLVAMRGNDIQVRPVTASVNPLKRARTRHYGRTV